MNTATIVQKLWNYCNVLRDDGMSYGDYPSTSLRAGSEQLALTPALSQRKRGKLGEMADERSRPPYNQASPVLVGYDWKRLSPSLALPRKRERGFSWGDELFDHYRHTLEELGKQKGLQ
jgi:type I restriction enzyme M protein